MRSMRAWWVSRVCDFYDHKHSKWQLRSNSKSVQKSLTGVLVLMKYECGDFVPCSTTRRKAYVVGTEITTSSSCAHNSKMHFNKLYLHEDFAYTKPEWKCLSSVNIYSNAMIIHMLSARVRCRIANICANMCHWAENENETFVKDKHREQHNCEKNESLLCALRWSHVHRILYVFYHFMSFA